MKQVAKTVCAFAFMAFGAVPASAGVIIGATSVSSPQGDFGGDFPLVNIINQSGLSAAYTSGVTDFATYTASATHEGLAGTGFTNTESAGPQQFTFDLGSIQSIDAIAIWNTASVGAVTRIEVLFDSDADFGNGTSGVLVAASALGAAGPANVFSFSSTATRFVHINGLATLQSPDFYGLGEVMFSSAAIPEPGTLAILGLGLAGLAAMRRRKR